MTQFTLRFLRLINTTPGPLHFFWSKAFKKVVCRFISVPQIVFAFLLIFFNSAQQPDTLLSAYDTIRVSYDTVSRHMDI